MPITKQQIVERLYTLGYFPLAGEAGHVWPPTKKQVTEAIDLYLQNNPGMPQKIETLIATRRCGIPDSFATAEAATSKWQFLDVKYYQDIRFPGIDPDFIAHCYDQAWASWRDICGLTPTKSLDKAGSNVHASAAVIDQQGQVLAYAYFPVQGIPRESQAQVYDLADTASFKDEAFFTATIAHETGHSLGLPHGPGGQCLMGPYITNFVKPQPTYDIPEAVARYGQFTSAPTPPTPPINPFPSFVGVW